MIIKATGILLLIMGIGINMSVQGIQSLAGSALIIIGFFAVYDCDIRE